MITQLPLSRRSGSQNSISSSRSVSDVVFSLTEPNAYLQKVNEEQDDYAKLREIEEEAYDVRNEQKRMKIQMDSLRSMDEIERLELKTKLQSFEQLETLPVDRLLELFQRGKQQADIQLKVIEEQINAEKESYRKLKIQIEDATLKVNQLDSDIGNF